ncbi:ATP-dependent RNA helicase supv3l1, mitochondrial [Dinochytrium kinnereticum]|nr:ATP-dependent RNA helicase supv3l1, mitochondrial [Dinochytrium kinnereticum]
MQSTEGKSHNEWHHNDTRKNTSDRYSLPQRNEGLARESDRLRQGMATVSTDSSQESSPRGERVSKKASILKLKKEYEDEILNSERNEYFDRKEVYSRIPDKPISYSQKRALENKERAARLTDENEMKKEMTNQKDKFLHFVKKLHRSKYIKQRLEGLNIDPEVAKEMIVTFSNRLKKDKLKTLAFDDALRSFVNKENMERIILPVLYHFIRETLPPTKYGLLDTLLRFSDLRTPAEWFPNAREMKRKIILHVGPTNSGKTYNALRRLESASSGVYAGPLRLLAHEIYERLNAAKYPCNLLTGEERRESDGVEKWAATVEMVPLGRRLEVAVIDEIQMISDEQRGWAWTQALLGLQADEIHLCGEPTAIPLVRRLCETTGEDVEIHTYERLTPLQVEDRGFSSSFSKIRPGDCVVAFSRARIFALRALVENQVKMKAAVIYGNLPPETRAEQARLFNTEGSGYDILIASDAIGMGLNLNIRRIVFETLTKFDGKNNVPLSVSQTKQIAGRAGRFNTKYSTGYVTTFHNKDLVQLQKTVAIVTAQPLESAGLYPKLEQVEMFSKELPTEPLSGLLDKFEDLARLDGDYFLCNLASQKRIADLIEPLPLSLRDKYTLVSAPANVEDSFMSSIMLRFARDLADGKECCIRAMVQLPAAPPITNEALRELEGLHKAIVLYLWLSFRFPTTFTQSDIATHLKEETEILINASLIRLHHTKAHKRAFGKHDSKKLDKATKTSLTRPSRAANSTIARSGGAAEKSLKGWEDFEDDDDIDEGGGGGRVDSLSDIQRDHDFAVREVEKRDKLGRKGGASDDGDIRY